VYESVRNPQGGLVDLRILYGNDSYWALSGLDPSTAIGRSVQELAPGIDRRVGLAGRLFKAMESGRTLNDRRVRVKPQTGRHAGKDRVFELEIAVAAELLTVSLRDLTAEIEAAEHLAADARRNAGLARLLRAAVDPGTDRANLLQSLAAALADTIGDLCLIIEQTADGVLRLAGVAGGPAGVAEHMSETLAGRPIPVPDSVRRAYMTRETLFHSPIPPKVRAAMVRSMRIVGLPEEVAATANSIIGASVDDGSGTQVGRIHMYRFGGDQPYGPDDKTTVEAMAAAVALVLERRTAEHGLATSLARFEAIFEQVPVAMMVVGSDRTVRLNEAALELYGRSQDEMARLSFEPGAPWIPSDQTELWAEMRQTVAAGGRMTGVRFALVRPDGTRRQVVGWSIPIVTRDGGRTGVISVLMDLTDRLSLEAQFRHAQKMEALGRLAGGIAHDFNNVLMAIHGYAQLVALDSRAGRPLQPDHIDQVVAATRRAIELTARLTTFARSDVVRRDAVDPRDMVQAVMPLIARLAPASIEIVTHLQPGLTVTLDRAEFEQVLVNLVVNAADAMPDGGTLTIEVEAVDLEPDRGSSHPAEIVSPHVLVAVSDTGVGMDEATRSRIFEPFYTTKGVGEGTGLGLSMAFAAVERADGRIWVYSEPGHGTTFKIYLPRSDPGGRGASSETRPADVVGGTESILLLEDDPLVRELLVTVLRDLGYPVAVAGRPSEALALASERHFDLLLSDVVMPEMTGIAAASSIRSLQPDLAVVFMSGYTARTFKFELGPRDTLVLKPLTPNEIARAVRDALDRR
jgi:two-component system cell cycle sensor histidine kinase/response regulator CckA